jgi:hypothetical protein
MIFAVKKESGEKETTMIAGNGEGGAQEPNHSDLILKFLTTASSKRSPEPAD